MALDQGTTSSRAIVFDKGGHILAKAQREFEQLYPNAGWVEHDPMEILYSQLQSVATVLASGEVDAKGDRCNWHHQPARDDDPLGLNHRKASL